MTDWLKRTPHALPMIALIVIWLLFFWRIWTPVEADRLTFAEGDFSAQFVAWVDYAAERLHYRELPLWNPYNYGGSPFQASSQTALTYPPRMMTLAALLTLTGEHPEFGDVYTAIQWEVMLHVLAASLFMSMFVSALITEDSPNAGAIGGLVAGIAYAYGGYTAGYPILQSPVLEAGIWLPLVLLGILRATAPERATLGGRGLISAAVALGMCFLAGHPQTGFFTGYTAMAFLAYRVYTRGWSWRGWLFGAAIVAGLGFGLAAIQLIPTAEFTLYTSRTGFTFADKAGGYSFEELANLLFPVRGVIWNSNHYGLLTLLLVAVALRGRVPHWGFFTGLAALAFVLTFGAQTPLYGLLYPLLPGLTLFRGQERAGYLVAQSFAILAGLGAAAAMRWQWRERPCVGLLRHILLGLLIFSAAYTLVLYIVAQTDSRSPALIGRMESGAFSTLIFGTIWLAWRWYWDNPNGTGRKIALIALLTFDLFSVTFMLAQNYQPIPMEQRASVPPVVASLRDPLAVGQRAASGGLYEAGYGTRYRLADVNGSDPLMLESTRFYLETLPPHRWRDLLAVGTYGENGTVQIVENPRGFAHLVYEVVQVAGQAEAESLLQSDFDTRHAAIIEAPPPIAIGPAPDDPATADLTVFTPEHISVEVETNTPALLTLSLPYFPGWEAELDGESTPILRTYAGLSGVVVPAGQHKISLTYHSRGLIPAGIITLISLLMVGGLWVRWTR